MEDITIIQVSQFLIGLATLLTAGGVLVKFAVKGVEKALQPFNDRIDKIEKSNADNFKLLQLQTDKNYLVRFLADIENNTPVDETELEHFWFTYDDYHKHNGNSYIDHKVEKLKKEGKL